MPVAQSRIPTAIDAIRAARAELMATHGACCASAPSLLIATAQRIVEHAPLETEARTRLRQELSELTSSLPS